MRDYLSFDDWQKLKAEKGKDAFRFVAVQCISGADYFKRPSSFLNNPNKAIDNAFRKWYVKDEIRMIPNRNVLYSAFLK